MPDSVDSETRRRIMRAVKGKDTRLKRRFRSLLWAAGVRGYRCNVRSVMGTPDLVWKSLRLAVFLDSAWWHGHQSRWIPGRLPAAWDVKIARNRDRDEQVTAYLIQEGWQVIRIWDFEVVSDPELSVERIATAIRAARNARKNVEAAGRPRFAQRAQIDLRERKWGNARSVQVDWRGDRTAGRGG